MFSSTLLKKILKSIWVHFSFLLENFLGFSMESTLIVSSVNPPKKFRCPYCREEGGGQTGCQNVFIFYVLIMGGGGKGSRQISQMSFNILFFFEGFP